MARQISDEGLALIKQWEGLRLTAYKDTGGKLTVGYGHTGSDVTPGLAITQERADALLARDLDVAARIVETTVSVPLTDNQFAALTAFVFNVGEQNFKTSTLLKKLNGGDYASVPAQLARWNKVRGRIDHGLVNRRAAEAGLWARGSFVASNYVEASAPRQGMATPQAAGAAGATGLGVVALGSQLIDQLSPYSYIKWVGVAVTVLVVITAIAGTIYAVKKG